MTYACGRQFSKYMERFYPVLQTGLAHHQARLWAGHAACGRRQCVEGGGEGRIATL